MCNKRVANYRPIDDAQDEKAPDQNGAWTADKNERIPCVAGHGLLTESRHCTMCTTQLKKKENVTSISPVGTILSSYLKI